MPIDVTSLFNRRADHRWERVCVGDILERLTWSRPDQVAITGWPGAFGEPGYERLTYRQADQIANRFANGLLARGLARGDRVLLVCENSVEAYLAKLATAKAGLVAVPVNPALASDVLRYLIGLAGPRFVIVDAELWPGVAEVIEAAGLRPDVTIPVGGGVAPGGVSFTEFTAGQPATEPDAVVHGDDIWEILFTSGTTAMPKGVMLSHSYAYMGAMSFALSLTRGVRVEADLRLCSFLPVIYHVADEALSLPAFLAGGSLVIGRTHDRWGEAVTAVVVPAPGHRPGHGELTEAGLIAFCRDRLAGFETPKAVIFADALPETVGGKVLKYRLRQQFADHYLAGEPGPAPMKRAGEAGGVT